jgi:hypothetical protein
VMRAYTQRRLSRQLAYSLLSAAVARQPWHERYGYKQLLR